MIETDNWLEDIIKGIPSGIKKPKYYEPITWHHYVKVEDLINLIEELSSEIKRLTPDGEAPVVLDKQFLNIVEEVSDDLQIEYLEEDGTTDMNRLCNLVEDLYKEYLREKERN
jgi:hypothetical protein